MSAPNDTFSAVVTACRDRHGRRIVGCRTVGRGMTSPQAEQWFYISFADETFLGGAYVRGDSMLAALTHSHQLGINPGGEAMLFGPLTTAELEANGVPHADRERLLTRDEVGSA